MKIFHICWATLCLIGNIYHLYCIFNRYFEYDVSRNVQIYTPELINVPAVIVCMNSYKLLRWDNFTNEETERLLKSDGFDGGVKGEKIYSRLKGEDITNLNETTIRNETRYQDFESKRLIHNIRKNFKSS